MKQENLDNYCVLLDYNVLIRLKAGKCVEIQSQLDAALAKEQKKLDKKLTQADKMLCDTGCPECKSEDVSEMRVTVNGRDGVLAVVCDNCGHTITRD